MMLTTTLGRSIEADGQVIGGRAILRLREVSYFQAPSATLSAHPELEVYADGEYICDTPVEISVVPRGLKVISP